jgi:hypothetical protein
LVQIARLGPSSLSSRTHSVQGGDEYKLQILHYRYWLLKILINIIIPAKKTSKTCKTSHILSNIILGFSSY